MRALAVVGLGAIVATAGACVALSGIGEYQACADTCDAEPPAYDASIHDARPPPEDTTSPVDARMPVEDTVTLRETSNPEDAEPDISVPTDSGPEVGPPVDSGSDADASSPDAGLGPTCGTKGTTTRCTGSQVCCQTLMTQVDACLSSCTASQGTLGCSVPSDCPTSKSICCANVTSTGALPPCTATALSTSCASTCADNPPTSCTFTGVVRLCVKDSDCAMDPTANSLCYNFQSSPVSWCATASVAALGNGVEQK